MSERDRFGLGHGADAPTAVRRRSSRPRAGKPAAPDRDDTLVDESLGAHAAEADSTPAALRDRTVAEAVLAEETTRARGFSGIAMFMIALVILQLPFLPGDPAARRVAGAALAIMFLTSTWAFVRAGRPGGYTHAVFRAQGWVLATCILAVEYYVGFYSPMIVVLSLGIYYLGQSNDRPHAFWLPLYVAVTWVSCAALTTFGVIEDRGFFSSRKLPLSAHIFMLIGVGCTLLATMWFARLARRSVREAIVESQRALILAQRREAQLAEAHTQLDRAMRAAVGKPGRRTGQSAGAYRLGLVIGVGAMGEVYAAEHGTDGRGAAVKLLHPDALAREDNVVRFLREVAVCQRLKHPNLVRVHDVGRMQDGAPYMVMDRLQGETLAAILRERGQLPLREVLELAQAVSTGLAHAHDSGVVHRDLKPLNLYLHRGDADARWIILDFGISKLEDSSGTLTRELLVGTPAYMSPEQALGQPVDHRSDLFALGSVLYRALTGQPAFPGKEAPRIMFDVAYRMPRRPSEQVPGLPGDVDLVFAIALAKDRTRRFASAAAFVRALEAAAGPGMDDGLRTRARALLREQPWTSASS